MRKVQSSNWAIENKVQNSWQKNWGARRKIRVQDKRIRKGIGSKGQNNKKTKITVEVDERKTVRNRRRKVRSAQQ